MVSAPFRERVLFLFVSVDTSLVSEDTVFFGQSKRFRAEDPRAFEECDPNVSVRRIEASFRKRTFQCRHSLRLPLSLGLALVAMFTGTVGSPLVC